MEAYQPMNKRDSQSGLLYPLMVIAAIAVTVFSAVGVATMMGWMPGALSGSEPAANDPPGPVSPDRGRRAPPRAFLVPRRATAVRSRARAPSAAIAG